MTDIKHIEHIFNQLKNSRRFNSRTLDIARKVIIHGAKITMVAAEYGIGISRVYRIKDEVLNAIEELSTSNDDWEEITLTGPKSVITQIKQLYNKAMNDLKK